MTDKRKTNRTCEECTVANRPMKTDTLVLNKNKRWERKDKERHWNRQTWPSKYVCKPIKIRACKICNKEYSSSQAVKHTCSKECKKERDKQTAATPKRIAKAREWYNNNQEYYRGYRKELRKNPEYIVIMRIRSRLNGAIKNFAKGVRKSDNTIPLLGCSPSFFMQYLEKLFSKGMSWKRVLNAEIHIDHIRPCASFDLNKESEQRKCFHYSNLQPLWAKDNLSKGAKYNQ